MAPSLVLLLTTERNQIPYCLAQAEREGVLRIRRGSSPRLCGKWRRRYACVNIIAQLVGILSGAVVAWANYRQWTAQRVGTWLTTPEGAPTQAGWIELLFQIPLFWTLVIVYTFRAVAHVFLIKDIAANSQIRIRIFHPDSAAGLRPFRRICMRTQYPLFLAGINIVCFAVVTRWITAGKGSNADMRWLISIIAGDAIVYLVLGPALYFVPLSTFRRRMQSKKRRALERIGSALDAKINAVIRGLRSSEVDREAEEQIRRLRSLWRSVSKVPVWPFDIATSRRFVMLYVVPMFAWLVALLRNS